MQFTVVGAAFCPSATKDHIKSLKIGDKVQLEADPENEYDPSAIKVLSDGLHIGFIERGLTYLLHLTLEEGEELEAEIVMFENTLKPIIEVDV